MLNCMHIYHGKYVNKFDLALLGFFQLDACRKIITLPRWSEATGAICAIDLGKVCIHLETHSAGGALYMN